jgi:CMP-N,N'-diacetyllegionaminic acid synthase
MNIVAIIPARAGSKGIPAKNIRLLGGYPLLAYSIIAARLTPGIERIIVSTDAAEIAEIARAYGGETPFLRPAALAQDHSDDGGFMFHALRWLRDHDGRIPDYLVLLRPTTPLRDPEVIATAIATIAKHPEATSLRSAHPAAESPFKWFQRDEAGYFTPLYEGGSNDAVNQPRQQFPDAYIPDGYVDIVKPVRMLASGLLFGGRMLGFVSPFCTEADTGNDLEFLEYDLNKQGSLLWKHLKKFYPQGEPRKACPDSSLT